MAGFVGSRFARWLLDHVSGVKVLGNDDLSSGYPEKVPEQVRWKIHSLGGSNDYVIFPLVENVDYVFHFAAMAAEGFSPFARQYTYRNNLLATAGVLNAVLETGTVKRLVYTSSMAVYGLGDPPFDEDSPCRPIDPYGIAKLACEQDLRVAGEQHGLDWCVVRPHNWYGPGQSLWQPYRNVLGIWMASLLQGGPIRVFGDGQPTRAFSYIDDFLPALWRAAITPEASRQTINLGDSLPVRIIQAAEMLREVSGIAAEIVHTEPRHEVQEAWSTWAKGERLLSAVPTHTLRDGLHAMWQWAQDTWIQFPRRRPSATRLVPEIRRGLYSFWREA